LEVESRSLTQQVVVSSKSEVRQCWTIAWKIVTSVKLHWNRVVMLCTGVR